jgi:hypothetical protein
MSLTYAATSIGELSPAEISTIVSVSSKLKAYGFTLRTPSYSIGDKAFQLGGNNKEVYLAHKPEKITKRYPIYYPSQNSDLYDKALDIVSAYVDFNDEKNKTNKDRHIRNVFLLLGHDLNTKANFLISVGHRKIGKLSVIAAMNKIPEFNILNQKERQKLLELAKELSTVKPIEPRKKKDAYDWRSMCG